jgi:hypothetical protein
MVMVSLIKDMKMDMKIGKTPSLSKNILAL